MFYGKKAYVLKVHLCGICGEQVGHKSIQCTKFQTWVHRCCSDVSRRFSLLSRQYPYVCRRCLTYNCPVKKNKGFKRGEEVLEEVEKFCYLGDMFSSYGGASEAVNVRIGSEKKKKTQKVR